MSDPLYLLLPSQEQRSLLKGCSAKKLLNCQREDLNRNMKKGASDSDR